MPWINVVDFKGFKSELCKQYDVSGIPSSFLIGKDGKIVAVGKDVREFALDEKLKVLFGK